MRNYFALLVLFMCIFLPALLFGDDLPAEYSQLFNEATLVAIAAVVGFVKMVKNIVPVGGVVAVVVTILVSLIYGVIQYGTGANGLLNGIVVGVFAALSFFLTKRAGYSWNPTGKKIELKKKK